MQDAHVPFEQPLKLHAQFFSQSSSAGMGVHHTGHASLRTCHPQAPWKG